MDTMTVGHDSGAEGAGRTFYLRTIRRRFFFPTGVCPECSDFYGEFKSA